MNRKVAPAYGAGLSETDARTIYDGALAIARRHRAQAVEARAPAQVLAPETELLLVEKVRELRTRKQTPGVRAAITRLQKQLNPDWERGQS